MTSEEVARELGRYIRQKTEELKNDPDKKETARAFLIKIGVLDKNGKPTQGRRHP